MTILRRSSIGVVMGLLATGCQQGPDLEVSLDRMLEEAVARSGHRQGVVVVVDSPRLDVTWQGAAGPADPATGEAMTPAHPVRIASNTKTYVAAAVLRLWEQGRIGLDDAIAMHLRNELTDLLRQGGYDPDAITVRHLLTHTSGLDDHGSDRYSQRIVAEPQYRWSRAEQVRLCVEDGGPKGAPGEVYFYSDTGYVLLGAILERITGRDLAGAVWSVIDREALGLDATWFETLEPAPEGLPERAHQFYGELDVTGFDPSFDLWGGGGIAATMGDLARFTRALFSGEVFEDEATLETMLTTFDGLAPAPGADPGGLPPGAYRMGVWVTGADGLTLHRHTGFWCTSATWVPELDLVVTATVNQHEARPLLEDLVAAAIQAAAQRPR